LLLLFGGENRESLEKEPSSLDLSLRFLVSWRETFLFPLTSHPNLGTQTTFLVFIFVGFGVNKGGGMDYKATRLNRISVPALVSSYDCANRNTSQVFS